MDECLKVKFRFRKAMQAIDARIHNVKKCNAQQRQQTSASSFGSRRAASPGQSHFERPAFRKTTSVQSDPGKTNPPRRGESAPSHPRMTMSGRRTRFWRRAGHEPTLLLRLVQFLIQTEQYRPQASQEPALESAKKRNSRLPFECFQVKVTALTCEHS